MKRIMAVFAAFVLALGFGLSVSSPAQASPPNCDGAIFCVYPYSSSPWGTPMRTSTLAPRNTCLDADQTHTYEYNKTGLVWWGFRVSDPTCQGAHVAFPPYSEGPVSAYGSGWTSIGAVMRTSATS